MEGLTQLPIIYKDSGIWIGGENHAYVSIKENTRRKCQKWCKIKIFFEQNLRH